MNMLIPHATSLLWTLFAGVAGAAGHAPYFLWPLMLLSYGWLIHSLLRAESTKHAFKLGWCWGFGYFVAGLYWVSISMTVDLEKFGWMIPFALIGFNGFLALFPALAGAASYFGKREAGSGKPNSAYRLPLHVFMIVLCLFGSEWLRGHILTGFPWNLAGYTWLGWDASAHSSVYGVWWLTALTIALSAGFMCLFVFRMWRASYVIVMLVCIIVSAKLFDKEALVSDALPELPNARIVQANIAQTLKWDPAYMRQALLRHIELSQWPAEETPKMIIWPEASFPYVLDVNAEVPEILYEWLQPEQMLVFGTTTIEKQGDETGYYNSLVAVDAQGTLLSVYHKRHLVPFGEYVPLRKWLPLERLAPGAVDFSTSDAADVMDLPNIPAFMPLICYESIFPQYSESADARWLVNITNDAWFGDSSGPHQHLHMARARAIEQGKPLLRAANTGMSAVINPQGTIIAQLPLGVSGIIDVNMSKNNTKVTIVP